VDFKEGQIKIYLTRTGLLMEGHSAQNPLPGVNECYGDFSPVETFPARS
jgi:hypothetical protein